MSEELTKLRVLLMQRLGDVQAAAREWGVRPDHQEGRFVAALTSAQQGVADVALAAAGSFDAATADMQSWIQEARETAEAQARRAEAQAKAVDAKSEAALAAVVEKLIPAATAALGNAVVIRERRRDRWITLGWVCAGAGLALTLVGGGYAWKAGADRPAVAFFDACLRTAVRSEGTGRLYCPVDALSGSIVQAQQQRR